MDFQGAFDDAFAEDDMYQEGVSQLDFTENVIFLVDIAQKMFSPVMNTNVEEFKNQARISVVMKTIDHILRTRIIKSPSDQFALVFYSAEQQNSPEEFSNVHIALRLNFLTSESIQEIMSFCGENGLDKLQQQIGSAVDSNSAQSLKFGLWQCQNLFSNKRYKNQKIARHIMLFTAEDDPCSGQEQLKQQIISKVQSMCSENIRLDVFPLLDSEAQSDFWKEIVAIKKQEDEEMSTQNQEGLQTKHENEIDYSVDEVVEEENVYIRLEDLQEFTKYKQQRKRTTGSMRFKFYDGFEIAVQMFALAMPSNKGQTRSLNALNNEVLVSKTAYVRSDTGAPLKKDEVQYAYEVPSGDKSRFPQVVLTIEEKRKLKFTKEIGLLLLGFKSMEEFKPYWQLRPATFLYPDEKRIGGSFTAFIALYTAMLNKNKFALCRYVRNASSPPKLVALVPQMEVADETGDQVDPPGFQMIYLPFADNIKTPEEDPSVAGMARVKADEEHVAACEKIIAKLQLEDFSGKDVPNPHLQRHYQVIEAIALQQPVPPLSELQDYSLPDVEAIKNASHEIESYKTMIYGESYEVQQQQYGKKRKANTSSCTYHAFEWEKLATDGKLNKLTVNDLTLYTSQHKLSSAGRKADIIKRIEEHLQT
eukprot:TRINITY_DN11721_c0_g1_i2.p1 TRINITY_DN11721_c0_g1~~TRINITY_DN11721_c0_g1_i2.p1  ORF type:complete len:646 (+),score=98.52 TRINITY_DN11721_c0_g1_i2:146-2083(+)